MQKLLKDPALKSHRRAVLIAVVGAVVVLVGGLVWTGEPSSTTVLGLVCLSVLSGVSVFALAAVSSGSLQESF